MRKKTLSKSLRFIINAAVLTSTALILRSISVYFTVYISNKLGAEGMGVFQLMMAVFFFAITVCSSGAGFACVRLVAEQLALGNDNGAKAAVKKCLAYSLVFGLFSAALLSATANLISQFWLQGKISAMPIYVLACGLPFIAVASVLNGYFTAVRRVAKNAATQILENLTYIAATVLIFNLMLPKEIEYTFLAIVLGSTVSEIFCCAFAFILFLLDKRKLKNTGTVGHNMTGKMLAIALPVAASSYIRSGLNTTKQLVIPSGLKKSGMSNETALSQYGIIRGMVFSVLLFPQAFLSAFATLVVPEFTEEQTKQNTANIHKMMRRIFQPALIFSICVACVFMIYAKPICFAVFGNYDAAPYLFIFAPLVVVMYLDGLIDAVLKGLNQQLSVVWINILDAALSITLLLVLLPIMGITGYIVVVFVSELINGFLSLRRLLKITHFKINFINWLLLPVAAMLSSFLVTNLINGDSVTLNIITSVGVYLAILYLFLYLIRPAGENRTFSVLTEKRHHGKGRG